jgi:hypothetical protein
MGSLTLIVAMSALLGGRSPVREFIPVQRVGHLPEVGAIGSRCEEVHVIRARQSQSKDFLDQPLDDETCVSFDQPQSASGS